MVRSTLALAVASLLVISALLVGVHALAQGTSSDRPVERLQPNDDPIGRLDEDGTEVMIAALGALYMYGGEQLDSEHVLLSIMQSSHASWVEQLAPAGALAKVERELLSTISVRPKVSEDSPVLRTRRFQLVLSRANAAATDRTKTTLTLSQFFTTAEK